MSREAVAAWADYWQFLACSEDLGGDYNVGVSKARWDLHARAVFFTGAQDGTITCSLMKQSGLVQARKYAGIRDE